MPFGVMTDCAAIFLGGLLGTLLQKHFPDRLRRMLPSIFGLCALTIGISLILNMVNLAPVVLAVILGTVIGEMLDIEAALERGLHGLEHHLPIHLDAEKMDAVSTVILLFCFSGIGIFGAMHSGMTGDHSILYAKAVLDFFTAVIFATTAGILVGCIALPQLLVGSTLFFAASAILPLISADMLSDFKACGGVLTLALGLKITGIKKFRVLNMLPALILVLFFSRIWGQIML